MAAIITASLDVMGGDEGAAVVIPGADIALVRRPDMRYRLYGDEKVVLPLLDRYPRVKAASIFEHAEISVTHGRQAEPGPSPRPPALEHVALASRR